MVNARKCVKAIRYADEQLSHVIIATYYNFASNELFITIYIRFKIIANELSASSRLCNQRKLEPQFSLASTVISGSEDERREGRITYISFLPLFFMEINRTPPRPRYVVRIVQFVAFRSGSESGVINDIVGLIAFRREDADSQLRYPRSCVRTGSPPFLIGEKCFNFVSFESPLLFSNESGEKSSGVKQIGSRAG